MSTELALGTEWYSVTAIGVILHREPTDQEYADAMAKISFVDRALWWVWGDMINLGERKYGESYVQFIQITGARYQTLANAASIAAKIPMVWRDPDTNQVRQLRRPADQVSPSAHAPLAKFSKGAQDHEGHAVIADWLEYIEREGMNSHQVRDAVRRVDRPGELESLPAAVASHHHCPECGAWHVVKE